MDFSSVPIIVICCYIFSEIWTIVFKKNHILIKLIPFMISIIGGLMGIIIYLTNPEIIFNVDSIWSALGIGIISGASALGTNKIIEKIFKNKGENKNGNEK